MALGDALANRNINRLRENEYISNFDYSEVEKEEVRILIKYEQEILKQKTLWGSATLEIGKVLLEAQNRLSKYKTGTFMKWYENIGFNKDTTSFFLKRYGLYLEYKDKKEYIEALPVRLVIAMTKKDVSKEVVEEAMQKNITSEKEFKNILNKQEDVIVKKINKKQVEVEDVIKFITEEIPEYDEKYAKILAEKLLKRFKISN